MTNEDNTTDVPISNWTLATGTKPGARDVYSAAARVDTQNVCFHATRSLRFAPHRCVDAHSGDETNGIAVAI